MAPVTSSAAPATEGDGGAALFAPAACLGLADAAAAGPCAAEPAPTAEGSSTTVSPELRDQLAFPIGIDAREHRGCGAQCPPRVPRGGTNGHTSLPGSGATAGTPNCARMRSALPGITGQIMTLTASSTCIAVARMVAARR